MEDHVYLIMFACLRSALHGKPLQKQEVSLFSKELLPKLFAVAKKHDIAHLVGLALMKNSLLQKEDAYYAEFQKAQIMAVYRYEQLNFELDKLCEGLEKARVPFIPLKGSVLRALYPEPWMRTSCDIDILIHEEDLDRAVGALLDHRGYVLEEKTAHDVSLFLNNKIHLELHYTLIGERVAKSSCKVLNDVWAASSPKGEKQYRYEMADEMFYFYHVAHMAKHFEEGGCGIRPFLDLWILDRIESADRERRDVLLERGNLLKFARVARNLSEVWFGQSEHDEVSRQLEEYILQGGVYGSNENRICVQQQKRGGKLQYALSRIFLPYDTLQFHYPILQKHRWLTPVMEVRRWCKLLFCGHRKRVLHELNYNQNLSDSQAKAARQLLENIGL